MERIVAGLVRIVHHTHEILFAAGSSFSVTSLACALAIAAGFLSYRHWRRRGRFSPRVIAHALFPRRILRHSSTTADFGYTLFNWFVYGGIFGMAGLSYQFLTNGILHGLIGVFGPVTPSALPVMAQRAGVTLVLFPVDEFGYWTDHYLKHRIPVLWEFHKVHHSAEKCSRP